MKHWRTSLLWAILALGGLAALVYSFLPQPVAVDLAQIVRGPMQVTVDEDGKTRVKEKYVVSAPLGGHMQRVLLRAGDPIQAGKTILAVIEPTDPALLDERARAEIDARVRGAEAARKQAEGREARALSALEQAQREAVRQRQLLVQRSASAQEYETAATLERLAQEDLRIAQHGVKVAEFEWEQAKAALTRTKARSPGDAESWRFLVLAPIDGQVLRVHQESAAVVAPGMKLLEVGDPASLEVEVDVLSTDAVKIRRGCRAILERWGGGFPLQSYVRTVEPSGFLKISALGVEEQRVNVILDLLDPPEKRHALGDGYRVEARIVIWEAVEVLKAPTGALFRHADDWAVFLEVNGRAKRQTVEVGHNNGLEAEIVSGLQTNDNVVLHPSDKMRDGVRVVPR